MPIEPEHDHVPDPGTTDTGESWRTRSEGVWRALRIRALHPRSPLSRLLGRPAEPISRTGTEDIPSISDAIVIKDGAPFFLCPPDGRVPLKTLHGYGLYYHDHRFLSGYELRLAGRKPFSLAATAATGTKALLELGNETLTLPDGMVVPKGALTIHWQRVLDGAKLELRDELTVHSYLESDISLPLDLMLAADFLDIFALRGQLPVHPGVHEDPAWTDTTLSFAYAGSDKIRRTLAATFEPAPMARRGTVARFELDLPARGEAKLSVRLHFAEEGAPPRATSAMVPAAARATPRSTRAAALQAGRIGLPWAGAPSWTTTGHSDDLLFDTLLARSFDDLQLLRGRIDGLRFYEAGLPWFGTLFGRDSLIAALQVLPFDTSCAEDTLRLLAARQGNRDDDWRDEQAGKILHELRVGELAHTGEIPHSPYYGTVDATPLFLILLARQAAWTGSLALFADLREHVERALAWIERASDADGYLVYARHSARGLDNQGWKDSGEGIMNSDGTLATGPIALAEVQGYVYAAKMAIATLFEQAGDPARATALRAQASTLQARFERDFWLPDLSCYALARGAGGAACAVVSSNAGQVLWSGIASPAHAAAVAARLMAPDMFGGWGIRTLSSECGSYRPLGYHTGAVWPHDNALIAEGFRRYSEDAAAEKILIALTEAAADFEHRRLPELFAGYARADFGVPVRYPVACHPQAWAAGTMPYLLATTLGLEPDGFAKRLRIVRPQLPPFVGHLELHDLLVGGDRVDLSFHRHEDKTTVEATWIEDGLEVVLVEGGRETVLRAPAP